MADSEIRVQILGRRLLPHPNHGRIEVAIETEKLIRLEVGDVMYLSKRSGARKQFDEAMRAAQQDGNENALAALPYLAELMFDDD